MLLAAASGVYCQGCNCNDCSNVPEKQAVVFQERQRILQREPMAFSSKVRQSITAPCCQ
jgi:hypothetical protein